MTILRFRIFRQNLNFENFRPDFSSEGHFWVVRHIFLAKSPYMGRTDLYLLVQSPYMGRTDPIFLEKNLKYRSSVRRISEKTPDILYGVVSQVNF